MLSRSGQDPTSVSHEVRFRRHERQSLTGAQLTEAQLAAINESSPSSSADGVAWDLNDLYSGVDDSKIESDLDSAEARADEFAIRYRDALGSLSAAELAEAVSALEEISELADAAVIFAQLLHAAKSDDPARGKLVAHVTERNSTIRNKLVFFELE